MSKILVVEDDQALQQAYSSVLQIEGFEVGVASDGVEALQKAEEFQPDLIILDMLMPNMDGITFLQRYQLKKKHPHVKVIVFSNVSVSYKIEEADMLGVDTYLMKSSFTPKEVVAKVIETLSKKES
jgi:DNA-binding response OmpR family regulator